MLALFAPLLLAAAPLTALELGPEGFTELPRSLELSVGDRLVTVKANAALRVQDLARYGNDPKVDGRGLIDWDWTTQAPNREGLTFTFDRPVAAFSLAAGDWGSDDDEALELIAFDCDGREVARAAKRWPITQDTPFATLTVRAPGICRVRYRSGGPFAGSTFVTQLRVGDEVR